MTNHEYADGYFCTYKAVFCIDGESTGCKKCLRSVISAKIKDPQDWTRNVWESPTTVATTILSKVLGSSALR
jgi:hypothetical protein